MNNIFNSIDFDEQKVIKECPEIMDLLLLDRSSKKNIKWCTDNYIKAGIKASDYMQKEFFVYRKTSLIKPRVLKSKAEQKKRSRDMAEVFTPSWVCNMQNNLIDNAWFGYSGAFNDESEQSWVASKSVIFNNKKWQDYVDEERMEITCGEAPYLTSRYDTTTGQYIEPRNRIGLLDRKLRVISENVNDESIWFEYAVLAYKRIYGYEYQGDNLLLARENLLMTYVEFFKDKFSIFPTIEKVLKIAEIISWNLWQMDGIKFVIPDSCHEEVIKQLSLFEEDNNRSDFCRGCRTGNNRLHNGIYCRIKDWRTNKVVPFIDLLKGEI